MNARRGRAERMREMEVVSTIVTIALLLVAVLLIVVVLLQKTKSAGVGAAFGAETQSFTARGKAASREAKLQRTTVVLAIVLGVLAIALAIIG